MFNNSHLRKVATLSTLVLVFLQIWLIPVDILDTYAHQEIVSRLAVLWVIIMALGITTWLIVYGVGVLLYKLAFTPHTLRIRKPKEKSSFEEDYLLLTGSAKGDSVLKEKLKTQPSFVGPTRTRSITKLTDAQRDEIYPLLDELYDHFGDGYDKGHNGPVPVPSYHYLLWSKINEWYPELDVGKDDEDIRYPDQRRAHNTLQIWDAGRTIAIITSRLVDVVAPVGAPGEGALDTLGKYSLKAGTVASQS